MEQVEFVRLMRKRYPEIIGYANANGEARSKAGGQRLKMEGVLPGVPDLFLAEPWKLWHGLYIEMKRTAGGRVSDAQRLIIPRLIAKGYRVEVCRGADEAMEALEDYLR
jgi:hypothetical protein